MAVVVLPSQLRDFCGGARRIDVPGATLEDVFRAVDLRCPGFYARIVADDHVRPELALALDGEILSLALYETIEPGSEIAIVPAMGGG